MPIVRFNLCFHLFFNLFYSFKQKGVCQAGFPHEYDNCFNTIARLYFCRGLYFCVPCGFKYKAGAESFVDVHKNCLEVYQDKKVKIIDRCNFFLNNFVIIYIYILQYHYGQGPQKLVSRTLYILKEFERINPI